MLNRIFLFSFVVFLLNACSEVPVKKSSSSIDQDFASSLSQGEYTELEQVKVKPDKKINPVDLAKRADVELVPQTGHRASVFSVEVASNGKFFVTGGKDSSVKVWRPDGVLIRTINVGYWVSRVAISPDSKYLVVGGWRNLALWTVEGKLLQRFNVGGKNIGAVSFSPGGKYIIAGMDMGYKGIYVYSLNGKLKTAVLHHNKKGKYARAIKFIDKNTFVAAMENNEIVFITLSGKIIKRLLSANRFISSLNVNQSGNRIISTGYTIQGAKSKTPYIELWDKQGKLVHRFVSHKSNSVAFLSAQGKFISVGMNDGKARIYNRSGKILKEFRIGRKSRAMHTAGNYKLSVFPDDSQLVTSDNSRFPYIKVNVWKLDGSKVAGGEWSALQLESAQYFPDGKRFITTAFDRKVRIWSNTGVLLKTLSGHRDIIYSVEISPDGKLFATGSSDDNVILWNSDGKRLKTFKGHKLSVQALAFTPDSQFLLTGDGKGYLRKINLKSYRIKIFRVSKKRINVIDVHPTKNVFAVGSLYDALTIWTLNGKELFRTRYDDYRKNGRLFRAVDLEYTPDGKHLVVFSGGRQLRVRNLKDNILIYTASGKFVSTLFSRHSSVNEGGISISRSGKYLAATISQQVHIFDLHKSKLVKVLKGHAENVNSVAFSPDEKYLISTSRDAITKIWNIRNANHISLLAGQNEWLMYTQNGFFDGSRYGGRLLAMSKGIEAYSVDQFALRFNRPDLIYQSLEIGDKAFVNHFRKQYEKRLSYRHLLNSGENGVLSVPEVTITGTRRKGKLLTVNFNVKDEYYDVSSYQVYVNDVPLYAGIGKQQQGKRKRILTEVIELNAGKNKIEISAANAVGGESLRATTYENFRGKIKPNLYFLGFGVSKYQNPKFNLEYAHKDVLDLGNRFSRMKSRYASVNIKTFINQQVTPGIIKQAKSFLENTKVDDVVILFIAGHGIYDFTDKATYYFMTHNARLNNLADTAISFDEIESLLSGIGARNKLFLLDTCESGEIEEGSVSEFTSLAKKSRFIPRSIKQQSRMKSRALRRGEKRSYLYEKDRYIYNNLQRRTGAIVFSSSRGGELSYESDKYRNGFFTEKVLEALSSRRADKNRDGRVSTHELQGYVSKAVAKASKNLQHPTVDRDNIYLRFSFPVTR